MGGISWERTVDLLREREITSVDQIKQDESEGQRHSLPLYVKLGGMVFCLRSNRLSQRVFKKSQTFDEQHLMSRQTRLVEQAIMAQLPQQRRSGLLAVAGVIVRLGVWGLLIFGLAALVPQVLPALMALQPKLPPPRGQIMDLVNFIRTPRVSVPLILCLTLVVDLPMAYLTSGNVNSRRWWSRLMMMIPLGIGLAAAGGFAVLYFQLLTLMVKDAGV